MSWIHEDVGSSMPSALSSIVLNHHHKFGGAVDTPRAIGTPREPQGHTGAEAGLPSNGYKQDTDYDASDSSETPRDYHPGRNGGSVPWDPRIRDPNVSGEEPPEPEQRAPRSATNEMESLHVLMPETMETLVLKQKWETDGLYGVGMLVSDAVPHVVQEITHLLDPQRRNLGLELSIGDTLCSVEDYPVEWANIDTIEQLVVGELGSSVQLTFRKKNTRDLIIITALRHLPVRVWEKCERWYEVKDEYREQDLKVDAGVVEKIEEIRRKVADGDGKLRDLLSDSNNVQTTLGFRVVLTSDESKRSSCVVKHVIPGSCADQVMGVKPGDRILEVNGLPVKTWDEKKLLENFRGSDVIATKCSLTVLRDGREVEAEVARTNAFFARQAEQLFQLAQQHASLLHAASELHGTDQYEQYEQQHQQLLESLRSLTERCLAMEQQRVLNERLLANRLLLLQRSTLTLLTELEASLRPVGLPPQAQPKASPPSPVLRPSPSPERFTPRSHAQTQKLGGHLHAAMEEAGVSERDVVAILKAMTAAASPMKTPRGEAEEASALTAEAAAKILREEKWRRAGSGGLAETPREWKGSGRREQGEKSLLGQWASMQAAATGDRLVKALAKGEVNGDELAWIAECVAKRRRQGCSVDALMARLDSPPLKPAGATAEDDKSSLERGKLLERQNRELLLELRRLQAQLGEREYPSSDQKGSNGTTPRGGNTPRETPRGGPATPGGGPTPRDAPRSTAAPRADASRVWGAPAGDAVRQAVTPKEVPPLRLATSAHGAPQPLQSSPPSPPEPPRSVRDGSSPPSERRPLPKSPRRMAAAAPSVPSAAPSSIPFPSFMKSTPAQRSPAQTPYLLGVSAISPSSPTPPPAAAAPTSTHNLRHRSPSASPPLAVMPPPKPTVRPPGGTFARPVSATLVGSGTVFYTTDGSRPSARNHAGSGPSPLILQVLDSMTLQAVTEEGGVASETAAFVFTIDTAASTRPQAGVGLLLEKSETRGLVRVKKVLSGGVAFQDGRLRVRDVLLRVDGHSVHGLELEEILELVKGPEGSTVWMELERRGPDGDGAAPLSVSVGLTRQRQQHQLGVVSTTI